MGEHVVAEHDRSRVTEERVRRLLSATGLRFVDHVVVDQGGGVQQLHAGRQRDDLREVVIAEASTHQRDRGAHQLAAPGECGLEHLLQEREVHDPRDRLDLVGDQRQVVRDRAVEAYEFARRAGGHAVSRWGASASVASAMLNRRAVFSAVCRATSAASTPRRPATNLAVSAT